MTSYKQSTLKHIHSWTTLEPLLNWKLSKHLLNNLKTFLKNSWSAVKNSWNTHWRLLKHSGYTLETLLKMLPNCPFSYRQLDRQAWKPSDSVTSWAAHCSLKFQSYIFVRYLPLPLASDYLLIERTRLIFKASKLVGLLSQANKD